MKKKQNILKAAIMIFVVLSTSLVTSETLAYWVDVQGAQNTGVANVATGDWTQAFPYVDGAFYETGDLVINNGVVYEAKNSGTNLREPGVDKGWNKDWN